MLKKNPAIRLFSLDLKRGFTLIELLVVISIISILSSTVLASINDARAKARDAKRIQDLRQIATALELYFDDNGSYPLLDGLLASRPGTNWAFSQPDGLDRWAILENQLAPYIPELPSDPINNEAYPEITGNYSYAYKYHAGRNTYALIAQFENPENVLRCELRGWRHRTDFFSNGNRPWCDGSHGLPNPYPYSPYLYDGAFDTGAQ